MYHITNIDSFQKNETPELQFRFSSNIYSETQSTEGNKIYIVKVFHSN